jgi:hypothetical protein
MGNLWQIIELNVANVAIFAMATVWKSPEGI